MGSFASKGGFYLWAHWRQGTLKPEDWQVFLREGVLVAPSVAFSEKRGSIRLNCSRISPEEMPLFVSEWYGLHDSFLKIDKQK